MYTVGTEYLYLRRETQNGYNAQPKELKHDSDSRRNEIEQALVVIILYLNKNAKTRSWQGFPNKFSAGARILL